MPYLPSYPKKGKFLLVAKTKVKIVININININRSITTLNQHQQQEHREVGDALVALPKEGEIPPGGRLQFAVSCLLKGPGGKKHWSALET